MRASHHKAGCASKGSLDCLVSLFVNEPVLEVIIADDGNTL